MNLVLVDTDELKQLIEAAVSAAISESMQNQPEATVPDAMNLNQLIEFLALNGCHYTKSYLYVMTSKKKIPYRLIGGKLVFSRQEIESWLKSIAKDRRENNGVKCVIESARRKLRNIQP